MLTIIMQVVVQQLSNTLFTLKSNFRILWRLEIASSECSSLQWWCSSRYFTNPLPVCLQMTNPAIQNDFSYYRRTLNRRKMVSHSLVTSGSSWDIRGLSYFIGFLWSDHVTVMYLWGGHVLIIWPERTMLSRWLLCNLWSGHVTVMYLW